MPRRRSTVWLVDLALLAALCALVGVAFTLTTDKELRQGFLTLMCGATVIWYLLNSASFERTCEDCGSIFWLWGRARPVLTCRDCGAPQAKFAVAWGFLTLAFWMMTPVVGFFAIAAWGLALDQTKFARDVQAVLTRFLAGSVVIETVAITALVGIGLWRERLRRSKNQTCESCGVELRSPDIETRCPLCARLKRDPRLILREIYYFVLSSRLGLGLLLLASSSILTLAGLAFARGDGLRGAASIVLGELGCWFLARRLTARVEGFRGLLELADEQNTMALARRLAGEPGTLVHEGPTTIWYSGSEDPLAIIREQIAKARQRFETLIGERNLAAPRFRILAFHDRAAYTQLVRMIGPVWSNIDHRRVVMPPPWSLLCLRTDEPEGWPTVVASVALLAFIEQSRQAATPPWVVAGLLRDLQAEARGDDSTQLNQRMIEAISSGAAWSAELFSLSDTEPFEFQDPPVSPKDERKKRRVELFEDQAWSILEYLLCESSPAPRKTAFQALLTDESPDALSEESLVRHLGVGYSALLEGWRVWVVEQAPRGGKAGGRAF